MSDSRAFDHVLVIMFENQYRGYVLENEYMRSLAAQGIVVANSFGVMHPSHPNYVASLAGELCNITTDYPLAPAVPQRSLVDLLEEADPPLSWKGYMQSYVRVEWSDDLDPTKFPPPFPPPAQLWQECKTLSHMTPPPYPFAWWHNAFAQFQRVLASEERWDRIEDEAGFWRDLLRGEFPHYAWFSPNLWNDGHYLYGTTQEPKERAPALVDQAAEWLQGFFASLRFPGPDSLLPPRTLVVVTYDESDFESDYTQSQGWEGGYDGPNQIYTVLLGDGIEPAVEEEGYNHYSLLATIERNFGVGNLGKNDADCNYLQFLWGRRFAFEPPRETELEAAGAVAAAGVGETLYVALRYAPDAIELFRSEEGGGWRHLAAAPLEGASAEGGIALAPAGRGVVLVYKTAAGLSSLAYDAVHETWAGPPLQAASGSVGAFALLNLDDGRSGVRQGEELMLAWAGDGGGILSSVLSANRWGDPVGVGFETDGDLELAAIGPSIYLIHKVVGGDEMNVVSYNTADFNVVTGTGDSDTTQGAWSPSEFPVAHFGVGPGRATAGGEDEPDPVTRAYTAGAPLAAATLDGVIHLLHPPAAGDGLQTETFSIGGVMTPANKVDFQKDAQGASNGYGTLAEAGWSLQTHVDGVPGPARGALALARCGSSLALLVAPEPGGRLLLSIGRYAPGRRR